MSTLDADVTQRFARIRLLSLDVDGVLTDGRLYFTDAGMELKTFSSQDGHALKMLQENGIAVAIITGRSSLLVTRRARELGIRHVFQGARDKRTAFAALLARTGLEPADVAHVGDDIPDLPVLRQAGLAIGVANQNPAMTPYVHYVTAAAGGAGAVREVCELILRCQGRWDGALARYL
ncbi:MAG: HAD family hydrolase [Gammaproteobacteria bacterium]|nr:HAD family hydrolase [Gammaproteobacteria bacterium]